VVNYRTGGHRALCVLVQVPADLPAGDATVICSVPGASISDGSSCWSARMPAASADVS
jgi:hypothetical protein